MTTLYLRRATRTIFVEGDAVQLGAQELRVLDVLIAHAGRPVGYRTIIKEGWEDPAGLSVNNVKAIVAVLRRKLEEDARQPEIIKHQHKGGYWLAAKVEEI